MGLIALTIAEDVVHIRRAHQTLNEAVRAARYTSDTDPEKTPAVKGVFNIR